MILDEIDLKKLKSEYELSYFKFELTTSLKYQIMNVLEFIGNGRSNSYKYLL